MPSVLGMAVECLGDLAQYFLGPRGDPQEGDPAVGPVILALDPASLDQFGEVGVDCREGGDLGEVLHPHLHANHICGSDGRQDLPRYVIEFGDAVLRFGGRDGGEQL